MPTPDEPLHAPIAMAESAPTDPRSHDRERPITSDYQSVRAIRQDPAAGQR